MTLTIGLREDNDKRSLKVEEEVFDKELNIWEVRNLAEFLQGCSLGKWAGVDGFHWERKLTIQTIQIKMALFCQVLNMYCAK